MTFKLFKQSVNAIHDTIKIIADSGFQGILYIHKNSETPKKKSKKHSLTADEKANNCRIAKERIPIEHINRRLKCFKMRSHRYRGKHQKHSLRCSLICDICNFEL